jgi:hypothetical protein
VNETDGSVRCTLGSGGVLCAKCQLGYQPSALAEGRCIECPSNAVVDAIWPWVVVSILVVGARAAWKRKGKVFWHFWSTHILPGAEKVKPVIIFKIVLGFYQGREKSSTTNNPCLISRVPQPLVAVLIMQPDVYDFQFPQEYLDFLDKLSLVTFDMPKYISVDCLVVRNYHSTLYVMAAAAAGMLSVLVVQLAATEVYVVFTKVMRKCVKRGFCRGYAKKKENQLKKKQKKGKVETTEAPKFLSACLVVSYLMYPSVTAGTLHYETLPVSLQFADSNMKRSHFVS